MDLVVKKICAIISINKADLFYFCLNILIHTNILINLFFYQTKLPTSSVTSVSLALLCSPTSVLPMVPLNPLSVFHPSLLLTQARSSRPLFQLSWLVSLVFMVSLSLLLLILKLNKVNSVTRKDTLSSEPDFLAVSVHSLLVQLLVLPEMLVSEPMPRLMESLLV